LKSTKGYEKLLRANEATGETMEHIIIALLVGTLAVVLWQVISIRRLAGLLDRVRDSQCEARCRSRRPKRSGRRDVAM